MSAVLDEVLAASGRDRPAVDRPTLSVEFERARQLRREKLDVARRLLDYALTAPQDMRRFWQQVVRHPLEVVAARRSQVAAVFAARMDVADDAARVMPAAAELAGRPLDGADRLPDARRELGQFCEMILARWTSTDELAQLVLDTIELPDWFHNGPNPPGVGFPQHWIDAEDDDPFALPESS